MEKTLHFRKQKYKEAMSLALFSKIPHVVLWADGNVKVENLDSIVLDRESALNKTTRVLFVAFWSSSFTDKDLDRLIQIQLENIEDEAMSS